MHFSTIFCLSAAISSAFAAPVANPDASVASTTLPRCKNGQQTFDIKIRSLENASGNRPITTANSQFLVDIGGPAGFSTTATTSYTITDTFITQTGNNGKIAVVKTTVPLLPHIGDIVFVTPAESIANNWSPLRCTGVAQGTLTCVASQRHVLQLCGKFVNMDPVANTNCQDRIAFDVVKTCKFWVTGVHLGIQSEIVFTT